MESIKEYTDGLRDSLQVRMEHALDDRKVEIADILSSRYGQVVTELTEPQTWYYSEPHQLLVEMLRQNIGRPSWGRPSARPEHGVLPSFGHQDGSAIHEGILPLNQRRKTASHQGQGDLGKGERGVRFAELDKINAGTAASLVKNLEPASAAFDRDKHLVKKVDGTGGQIPSQVQIRQHEKEAIRIYRRFKASQDHSKGLPSTESRSFALRRCASHLQPATRNYPAPFGSFRSDLRSNCSNHNEVGSLSVVPRNLKETRLSAQHGSPEKDSSPRRVRKQKLPLREAERRPFGHRNDKVVFFDNWIRPLQVERTQHLTQMGDEKEQESIKSPRIKPQSVSKSTQTENEANNLCKVVLFTVPQFAELRPSAGLHGGDSPYISALKSKSTANADLAHCPAQRQGMGTNFQLLLDNADKRLTGIEQEKGNSHLRQTESRRKVSSKAGIGMDNGRGTEASHILEEAMETLCNSNSSGSLRTVDIGTNTSPIDRTVRMQPAKNHSGKKSRKKLLQEWRPISDSARIIPGANSALCATESVATRSIAGTHTTFTDRMSPNSPFRYSPESAVDWLAEDSSTDSNGVGNLVIKATSGTTKSLPLTPRAKKALLPNTF
ncbi:uncharacterized protein LOC110973035 [Acanthaster planci]|uniref:Uncharacterized protein LOC110973035 n=1 Tax=Acanthaster planci TaxID=133434 RepID=A0A8B7XEF7_ACAPL|nr:uncharacterized protein LOC110973035 [Acanthaster planci]